VLQDTYDAILPFGSTENQKFDPYELEHSDLELSVQKMTVDFSKTHVNVARTYLEKADQYPVLRTGQPLSRPRTFRQNLLTLVKRNFNTPDNSRVSNLDALKEYSFERFLDAYCLPDARARVSVFEQEPISSEVSSIAKWLADLKKRKLGMIERPDEPVEPWEVAFYEMLIKPEPKNKLETMAPFEYAGLQNLVVHKKRVNALFSPIFKQLFERFSSLLRPDVYCHLRKNIDHLNSHLNCYLDPREKYTMLEIDQEKFDKSQTRECFEVEMYFLERLGLDKELLAIWGDGHESSTAINFANGIKCYFVYQRKTGDAMTCFGNTLISMAAMATVFDLKGSEASYFVGDDSFIFSKDTFQMEEGVRQLSYFFNLKGKVINTNHGFFCSYFFANNGERFLAMVDPLKRIERLGKPLKFSEECKDLEEHWVSFGDLFSTYDDFSFYESLATMVKQRYNTDVDMTHAMCALYELSKDFSKYKGLYEPNEVHN